MFATTTVRFALVAAALSSLTGAAPLFNFGRKEAVAMVRRAENDGQLAQGTNFYFTTLHLEDACSPGQVACVSGNYATCSGEGNWEITPCTSGTTCLATPASSPSGISIQCTSQDVAQSSIQNAGGNPNTLIADFHVTDAPFSVDTVASSSSSVPASTATETSSAPADTTASSTASPTDVPSESASATETSASSTCTPDDGEGDGTIAETSTETASPSATETVDPSSTCTEEPVETETITVIVVPVPSSTGVFSTTTLFPEQPEPTVVGTDVPVPTESSTEVPSSTESSTEPSTESVPTEEPSYTEPAPTEISSSSGSVPTESSSSSESVPTESSSSSEAPAPAPTASASSSESVTTVTTIFIDPGLSIPALPSGTGAASTPVAIPVVSVVGTHTVPAKRMVRVVRRS